MRCEIGIRQRAAGVAESREQVEPVRQRRRERRIVSRRPRPENS
jgi:hypothetical protein